MSRGLLAPTATPMSQVCLSGNGHLLATLTEGGDCQVWHTKTGRELDALRHTGVTRIAVSRARQLLAAVLTDGTLRAWELDGGREVVKVDHSPKVRQLLFRPDGAQIGTLGEDLMARLVWTDDPDARPQDLERAYALAFSPDSRWVATGGNAIVLWGPD